MTHDPLSDVVAQQYQKWVYPEPIHDLPGWLIDCWEWYDPSHAHPMLWGNRADYNPDIDILVAGCGTNQAAVLAYTNPEAKVTAIDVSEASLAHHRLLRDRYQLHNLELHLLPIEQVETLDRDFDLIVSTGVLHHLNDPVAGLRALGLCLKAEGIAAIMLYARYGRLGVEIMQSVFQEMGLLQNKASLDTVKETIRLLPKGHPLRSYVEIAPDLEYDAGLVDTFLHGRDRSYTVDDCLDLVDSAGLAFHDWFLKSPYYPPLPAKGPFYSALATLPETRQWSIMERIHTQNACHFFTACRTDLKPKHAPLEFQSPRILMTVPKFRFRCGVENNSIFRPGWQKDLDPRELSLARQVDGKRTIGEIVSGTTSFKQPEDVILRDALWADIGFFQSLWQRDFLSLGFPS